MPEPITESNRPRVLSTVIGAIGEGILTLGILMGLFVVWEVWWTDVIGTRHQREIIENLDWGLPAIPVLGIPGSSTPTVTPSEGLLAFDIITSDDMESEQAPPIDEAPGQAETFAAMYVPRWGVDYVRPISEGVSRRKVLDPLGIGHYPDTAMPGGWGNFAVAGHRTTFGKPFDRIEELVPGDVIVVRTESTWYVYRVTEAHIVSPSFSAAVAQVPGDATAAADNRYITLTTCHPRLSASKRYVVYGVLDYWALASAGYPPEVVPEEATVPSIATGATDRVMG